ncbi:MAG TPA: MEDS domain-containing protein [Nitrospira sp.]|nr:MEDS domain-containing protein [Nitrospira sp.]
MRPQSHAVKFYDDASFLVDSVVPFLRTSLLSNGTAIAVLTPKHRQALEAEFGSRFLGTQGRLTFMDGRDTLARFMVDGEPNEEAFLSVFEPLLREAAQVGPISVFGEMVALLWEDRHWQAAVRLEELWNRLAEKCPFSLLCAYPLSGFSRDQHTDSFLDICGAHSRIILTTALA